ncbi:Fic family protein [Serratia marcescens]|uniref:Fic family protein n=1 Tax=Serratia marcescens TaxID=615 RepID=UPI0024C4C07E|nr:Fic family protein [Serratia marcescens]MDK1707027.1 Fic family protein [Serratia marcescens]
MKIPPDKSEYIMDAIECAKALTGKDNASSEDVDLILHAALFPVSAGGKYLHWQDITDRTQSKRKALANWSLLKIARAYHLEPIAGLEAVLGVPPSYMSTALTMKTTSLIDRNCTAAGLDDIMKNYALHNTLFSAFADEESIASSQMEGAATTRVVAKKMLQEGRQARNEGEKMIIGNKQLMDLAWESRFEPMSQELLLQFHLAASQGIDDSKYHPGTIRVSDDIRIEGRDGEIVHQPPPAAKLNDIISSFINWINIDHSTKSAIEKRGEYRYMHPLIKACIIHFCMGFIHPFRDGNGRVARALCYWQLFRSGYEAFRYISISKLLKEAPVKYGESYLKSETDNMDLTYFIDYQCSIFERAVEGTLEYARQSAIKLQELDSWLFNSGLRRKMTETQKILINSIICMPDKSFTIKELSEKAGISASAARQNLEGMLAVGLLSKSKGGGARPDHYSTKQHSTNKLKSAIAKLLD